VNTYRPGYSFETWEVKNTGKDEKIPVDQYPRLQIVKLVFRFPDGRFHGATNYKERIPKNASNKSERTGSRVSRRATGLRLVK
jgi:hypothetical protein